MRVNILGNGDHAQMFKRGQPGKLLVCNMPPFAIPTKEVHASCMVDFKMMLALTRGEINLDMYDWILGTRPRIWMEMQPGFYLKYASKIKGFHQYVPSYAGNATNFNCGHMAVDYACRKMKATEVHMYGFDTLFDHNMRSYTDLILSSDRSDQNNFRLLENWRPIWTEMFKEFKGVQFYIYHSHDKLKIPLKSVNVDIVVQDLQDAK